MSEEKINVLEFIENTKTLPKKITIDRTTQSKYLFHLVVRQYRTKLDRCPEFLNYQKAEINAIRGQIEEHSLLGDNPLYVMEGFSRPFVDELNLPEDTYVVAETEDGELKTPNYQYRNRRDILKVLSLQLGLKLSLRELLKIDWSDCREYADFESILRKVKVMGWTEEELEETMRSKDVSESILILMKKGRKKELLEYPLRYGPNWVVNHLMELITQLIHLKALKLMGYEEDRAAKEMEIGWYRAKELEEASRILTREELITLANRIIDLDHFFMRKAQIAVDLLLLNTQIGIVR